MKDNALPLAGESHPVHPLRSKARVLLSSAWGPYAVDDDDSRRANPMELYHNQVTREQGAFSLRMHHRSFGLMLIQANLEAPCTLLDFPTRERFIEELRARRYDVVGIGAIIPNLEKVRKMCAVVRELQPHATIVVGGHVANYPGVERLLDADHVVRGEGIAWMRRYLGEDDKRPIAHPAVASGSAGRTMGVALSDEPVDTAAMVVTSVGCPMGCNFCATSAMFGGKGASIQFYESGDELFRVMSDVEAKLGARAFFLMDENFLLHRRRALRLLELMEEHDKAWSLYLFSSAHVISRYPIDVLVRLGVSWVWMGLEGEDTQYQKLAGIDTRALVRELQDNGVRVLGSSIIGLEHHTRENIGNAIDYATSHDTDFHQFMLYTPIPGTPLYAEHEAAGDLLSHDEVPLADVHGQARFNFRHRHLAPGDEGVLLQRAFQADFERNGPSVLRIARTTLRGWRRHKHHPSARVRRRFAFEAKDLALMYPAALWAANRRFRRESPRVAAKLRALLGDVVAELGARAWLAARVVGPYVWWSLAREERRLASGAAHEPATCYEHNPAAERLMADGFISVETSRAAPAGARGLAAA